jgi:purine-binding chemotaxis protein CheW
MSATGNEPLYPTIPILVFRLADQSYALPLGHIRQIIDIVAITRLPDLPSPLEGIIDVHGRVTVVVDLRRRLGELAAPPELHTPLLLVELLGRSVALIVDEVLGVREISSADFEVADDFLPSELPVRPRFIASVGKTGERLLLLLDPSQLVLPAEMALLDQRQVGV